MRTLLLCVVLLAACRRSVRDVDAKVVGMLRTALPGLSVETNGSDAVLIKRGTEVVMDVSLTPLRVACAESGDACDQALANTMATVNLERARQAGAAPDPDKRSVRLLPKPAEWLRSADELANRTPSKRADNVLERQPFVGELSWVYGFDDPAGMVLVSHEKMVRLGVDQEQLHALALENLAKEYPTLELHELSPEMWALSGSMLAPARLALIEQWRDEAKKHGGTLLMTVPSREVVLVIDDAKYRALLQTMTDTTFEKSGHPLSKQVFKWAGDGWVLAE